MIGTTISHCRIIKKAPDYVPEERSPLDTWNFELENQSFKLKAQN